MDVANWRAVRRAADLDLAGEAALYVFANFETSARGNGGHHAFEDDLASNGYASGRLRPCAVASPASSPKREIRSSHVLSPLVRDGSPSGHTDAR